MQRIEKTMPTEAVDLYTAAKESHEKVYRLTQALQQMFARADNETRANIGFACREAYKFADDSRKLIEGAGDLAERMTCLDYLQTSIDGEPIRTEYVTATPDMKVSASVPTIEKNPIGYQKLMDYLGIDPVLRDKGKVLTEEGEEETEVIKVNWNGFTSLLSRLQQAGYPMPDGIDPSATYTTYRLRYRKKKGVPLPTSKEKGDARQTN